MDYLNLRLHDRAINISCTVVFAKSKLVQIHFFVWCILLFNKFGTLLHVITLYVVKIQLPVSSQDLLCLGTSHKNP